MRKLSFKDANVLKVTPLVFNLLFLKLTLSILCALKWSNPFELCTLALTFLVDLFVVCHVNIVILSLKHMFKDK